MKESELEEIDKNLKMITGVIETSLFYQVATKALVAGETDGIKVIESQEGEER